MTKFPPLEANEFPIESDEFSKIKELFNYDFSDFYEFFNIRNRHMDPTIERASVLEIGIDSVWQSINFIDELNRGLSSLVHHISDHTRVGETTRVFKKLHFAEWGPKHYSYKKYNSNMNNVQYFRSVNDYSISAHEQFHNKFGNIPLDTKIMVIRNVKIDSFDTLVNKFLDGLYSSGFKLSRSNATHYDTGEQQKTYSLYEQRFFELSRDSSDPSKEDEVLMSEVYAKDGYAVISLLGNFWIDEPFSKTRDELRETFKDKTEKKPFFYTISATNNGFQLKMLEINNDYHDLLLENYNDDFSKVNDLIISHMDAKKRGLVLLHGDPGTGKSCYIKYLISRKSNRKIVYIPPHLADSIASPNFISFVRDELQNCVLVIEDAETILRSREEGYSSNAVANLLNITDGILGDALNILIICTFNMDRNQIDSALRRKGRMIAEYGFKVLTLEKTNFLMKKMYNIEVEAPMTLTDIYNHEDGQIREEDAPKRKIGFY